MRRRVSQCGGCGACRRNKSSLKTGLAKGQPVSTLTRYVYYLPPIRRSPFRASNRQPAVYGQKLHPFVAQKIAEMVLLA